MRDQDTFLLAQLAKPCSRANAGCAEESVTASPTAWMRRSASASPARGVVHILRLPAQLIWIGAGRELI